MTGLSQAPKAPISDIHGNALTCLTSLFFRLDRDDIEVGENCIRGVLGAAVRFLRVKCVTYTE